jgi:hypothetical protein
MTTLQLRLSVHHLNLAVRVDVKSGLKAFDLNLDACGRIKTCEEGSLSIPTREPDALATEILRKTHKPIEFVTGKEVESFLDAMKELNQPTFPSKLIFVPCIFEIEIMRRFAVEFGRYVTEYTFLYRVVESIRETTGLNIFVLLQNSPNTIAMAMRSTYSTSSLMGLSVPMDFSEECQGDKLPVYWKLRRIVWREAIYGLARWPNREEWADAVADLLESVKFPQTTQDCRPYQPTPNSSAD